MESVHTIVQELTNYAEISNDGLGEYAVVLVTLFDYRRYMSKEGYTSLYNELERCLENFKKEYSIVTRTETREITYKELSRR